MAKFRIISKDGTTIRYEGCPRYSGSYMGVPALDFSEITSPVPIAWEIGDYVDYRNGRYYLYSLPEPKKQARRGEYGAAFVYSGVQFHSPAKELEIALFRDIVTEDNEVHFSTMPDVSTYEDVYGIARRINACMDDLYPGKWRIEVYESDDDDLNTLLSETREFSISGGSCLDALSLIYDIWKNVGWIHTTEGNIEVITIARANVRDEANTTSSFGYGKDNGLTAIRRASANKDEFATRLYVYGSERNIPPRYYNSKNIRNAESVRIPNLMLPLEMWGRTDGLPDPRLAYLEADESIIRKYGLIPRVVRFDGAEREEIYPSIEGLTEADVRVAMTSAGQTGTYLPSNSDTRIDEVFYSTTPDDYGNIAQTDGTTRTDSLDTTFILETNNFGFDIASQASLAGENSARISMKSGQCAGREFTVKEVKWDGGTWVLTMERQVDDSLNMLFPNLDYQIMPGDRFVLLDIAMPEYYITLAQARMLKEGQKVLADYTRTSAFYEPKIDAKVMYQNGVVIREGMYMKVFDEDIIDTQDNADYVIIDTLSIDEKTEIPTYNVTLREQKRTARGISALEVMIEDAKENTGKVLEEAKQFSKRSFASALQTIDMLKDAFKNFSEGIDPVTVQTMALLAGDESLQFKFVSTASINTSVNPGFSFDTTSKTFKVARQSRLMHMTLGINEITSEGGRSADEYLKWTMPTWTSEVLGDAEKAYYLYAKVPRNGTLGAYLLLESVMDMKAESNSYYLLVGILNAEKEGEREFTTIYGFTEILPGRITTDIIRSADGETYFDLERGEIGGVIKFKKGSEGIENLLDGQTIGGQNMLRNSGFTGNYVSEPLADDIVMDAAAELYSSPFDHWTTSGSISVVGMSQAVSGKGVSVSGTCKLSQTMLYSTVASENYVISFKGKASSSAQMTITVGGKSVSVNISSAWDKYAVQLSASSASKEFSISFSGAMTLCDLQLERGTIATSWSNSPYDNSSDRAYYQALKYLSDAIKGTTIIDGGLVLTNTLKLGNDSNDSAFVEMAGANGRHIDEDSPAFWAGGTMDQAIELISRVRNGEGDLSGLVDFVVTHGGMAVLRNLKLFADSGALGGLIVTDRGLTVDTDSEGSIEFTKRGIVARQKDRSFTEIGTCGSQALLVMGKDAAGGQCYPEDNEYKIAAQINAADKGHAIHSLSGLFAGLRPNIRAVYESAALDALDHTVIVDNDAQMTLSLPSSPRTGQTYKIIHRTDKAVTLSSQYVIIDVTQSYSEVSTISERGVTELTYYDEMWYAELK